MHKRGYYNYIYPHDIVRLVILVLVTSYPIQTLSTPFPSMARSVVSCPFSPSWQDSNLDPYACEVGRCITTLSFYISQEIEILLCFP